MSTLVQITEAQVVEVVRGINSDAISEATRFLNNAVRDAHEIRGSESRVEKITLSVYPNQTPLRSVLQQSFDVYGRRIWVSFYMQPNLQSTSEALRASNTPGTLDESRSGDDTGEGL